jgi:very-short-patch-repair endonuclease
MIERFAEELRETLVTYFLESYEDSEGKFYANLLLDCSYEILERQNDSDESYWNVVIRAPAQAFRHFNENKEDLKLLEMLIRKALQEQWLCSIDLALKRGEARPGWDEGVRRYLAGDVADNQGAAGKSPILDDLALRYKSHAEVALSKALRRTRVMFFPLPVAVITVGTKSHKREPDFLICDAGRWGILEVQGDEYHKSATADHERAELLQRHGIKYVRFYSSQACHSDPDAVVRKFLEWLRQMYATP